MRAAGYVLLIIATTAFMIVGGIVAVIYGSKDDGWGIVFVTFGCAALITGPLVMYGILAFWNVRRSISANQRYRRYRLFAIVSTVTGAIFIAMWGIIVGVAWWVVILFIAIGVALLGGVIVAGPLLQRNLSHHLPPASLPWEQMPRAEIRRVGRTSLIAGSAALVIAVTVAMALLIAFDSVSHWPNAVLGVVYVTLFTAVTPVFVANFRLTRLIRETLDGDMGLARKFARVVVKNKPDDLTEDQRRIAARWASLVWLLLVGQLVVQLPILLVVLIYPLSRFLSGQLEFPLEVFLIVMAAAFLFLVVYAVPVTIRSIVRARRYAERHADLIASAS